MGDASKQSTRSPPKQRSESTSSVGESNNYKVNSPRLRDDYMRATLRWNRFTELRDRIVRGLLDLLICEGDQAQVLAEFDGQQTHPNAQDQARGELSQHVETISASHRRVK